MRKCVLSLCLSVLVTLPIYSSQPATPDTQKGQSTQFQLNNPRGDVLVTYAKISAEFGVNRSRAFAALSPTMQADLWILHLDFFLQDHDDLTLRQRMVISEAIRFIAGGPFKVTPGNQAWKATVDLPLKAFETRAVAAFGTKLAFEAFAQLGPQDPYSNLAQTSGVAVRHVEPEAIPGSLGAPMPDCECATDDDWCCVGDCPTSPTPKCHPNTENCTPHVGCGWFWLSGCNGTCGA